MLEDVTYYLIFGKPLIMYLGLMTLLSFSFTASIAIMNKRDIKIIPFRYHPKMAIFSLTLAIIHGTLGVLAYF